MWHWGKWKLPSIPPEHLQWHSHKNSKLDWYCLYVFFFYSYVFKKKKNIIAHSFGTKYFIWKQKTLCSNFSWVYLLVCRRCHIRVIDTFGTEPAYNHEEYATLHGYRTNWGYWNLHAPQYMTMFRTWLIYTICICMVEYTYVMSLYEHGGFCDLRWVRSQRSYRETTQETFEEICDRNNSAVFLASNWFNRSEQTVCVYCNWKPEVVSFHSSFENWKKKQLFFNPWPLPVGNNFHRL